MVGPEDLVGFARTTPARWLFQGAAGSLVLAATFLGAAMLVATDLARGQRRGHGAWRTNLGVSLLTTLVLAGLLEAGFRTADRMEHGWPLGASMPLLSDEVLGWKGRREFPAALNRSRTRLLVVGDSFTEARGVAREDAFPAVVARELDIDVYSYGAAGYGTLQELMVVDRLLGRVRPHALLLQLSANDLINNEWSLESRSLVNNNLHVRPYLFDGARIEYRYPSRLGRLGLFLATHSRAWYHLRTMSARLQAELGARGALDTIEAQILRGARIPAVASAQATTRILLSRLRERAGDTPIAAFISEEDPVFMPMLRQCLHDAGIPFVDGIPQAVTAARQDGATLTLDGHHWNAAGHAIVGRVLSERLSGQVPAAARSARAAD